VSGHFAGLQLRLQKSGHNRDALARARPIWCERVPCLFRFEAGTIRSGSSMRSYLTMQRSAPPTLNEIARTASALSEERRFAYLREACAGDEALYKQAIELFQPPITHPEWWADTTATNRSAPSDPTVGMLIGRYIVTGKIGTGGMSDVLLAVPRDDSGARVAIKLIRRVTASPQLHSRLKVERQILGALNHPNIARLLDGGNTDSGTPYLVMEYLQGEPIDRYCNRNRLTITQRLRLFQSVCRAVHAAHGLSIVHRDLKPSNILVTAAGIPKLMDFGIAKLLDERQVEQTQVVTHADVRLLTPDYASPEQIRGDAVTTASDIYALGVLLYELLTGSNPRSTAAIRKEASGTARDDSAMPPLNDRIAKHLSDAPPAWLMELCQQRSTRAKQLNRELASDLNTIVLTALHQDPARRHASAELFAARIDQYLTGQLGTEPPAPANAQPESSRSYGLAIALAVLALVVISILVSMLVA
jgi:serine/threonine protein kinase